MKFKLNEEIRTFEGDAIHHIDSEIARMVLRHCCDTLEELTAADEPLDSDALLNQFRTKAAQKALGEKLTYRQAMRGALLHFGQGDTPKEGEQLKRYDMLEKLAADTADLESKEIVDIRKAVAAHYKQPIIIGRVRDLLEGKKEKAAEGKKQKIKNRMLRAQI